MKAPFAKLMKKDWKIVDHWVWYVVASCAILLVGLILALTIKPVIGIEFQSGFVINVRYMGGQLTDSNRDATQREVTEILEGLKFDDDGTEKSYGIEVREARYQETGGDPGIRFVYRSDYLFGLGNDALADAEKDIKKQLEDALIDPDNPFVIKVESAGRVTPTISSELLLTAIAAIIAASAVMLLYVMFRFELASGLAAIIALIHDIAMMFVFMVFCRIEISSTFIAALVAILGYSINNTLVVFDRVRENVKSLGTQGGKKGIGIRAQVNKSLKETFGRSVNTTVTTMIAMILLCALGVSSIRVFSFPIIIGLISGAYSSFCLAPSLYVLFKEAGQKRAAKKKAKAAHNGGSARAARAN